jgi:cellulose synthase/poly-beta-1,6-N-acetylglucosamine synthase-like glycosyltransferase
VASVVVALAVFLFIYSVMVPLASLANTRFAYRRRKSRAYTGNPHFRVGVFVPCQDANEHLRDNLLALASQDYPAYTVTFVTDTDSDPAVPIIRSVVKDRICARHMVAGIADTLCSQQNHVQAISMSSDTESQVLVKCDSDMRPAPGWLRDFVRPYNDPRVAATTSHHWISPPKPRFADGCYTVFSGSLTALMGLPGLPWLWGGCFGIRRSVFHAIDVPGLWSNTGTDDSTLRNRLVSTGNRVIFVPDCVAPTLETHENLRVFIRWLSRQAYHGKIYLKPFWLSTLLAETLATLAVVAAAFGLVANAVTNRFDAAGVAALAIILFSTGFGPLVKLSQPWIRDIPLVWWAGLVVPTHVLSCYGLWRTVFMSKLSWRGNVYRFNRDGTVSQRVRQGT